MRDKQNFDLRRAMLKTSENFKKSRMAKPSHHLYSYNDLLSIFIKKRKAEVFDNDRLLSKVKDKNDAKNYVRDLKCAILWRDMCISTLVESLYTSSSFDVAKNVQLWAKASMSGKDDVFKSKAFNQLLHRYNSKMSGQCIADEKY